MTLRSILRPSALDYHGLLRSYKRQRRRRRGVAAIDVRGRHASSMCVAASRCTKDDDPRPGATRAERITTVHPLFQQPSPDAKAYYSDGRRVRVARARLGAPARRVEAPVEEVLVGPRDFGSRSRHHEGTPRPRPGPSSEGRGPRRASWMLPVPPSYTPRQAPRRRPGSRRKPTPPTVHVPLTTTRAPSPRRRAAGRRHHAVHDIQLRAVGLGLDGAQDAANVAGVDAQHAITKGHDGRVARFKALEPRRAHLQVPRHVDAQPIQSRIRGW